MKKILSVLCVLAMVASFACISAFADDAATPSFALVADPVVEGETTVTVYLQATLPAGTEVTQGAFKMTFDENLTLAKAIKNAYPDGGMVTGGQNLTINPHPLIWIWGTDTLPAEATSNMIEIVFNLPEGAKAGDTYEVGLEIDTNNAPSNINGDVVYADAPVSGCTITVVEPVVTTEPPVTDPVTTEPVTDPIVTTEPPVASESETDAPVVSSSETDAPVVSSSEVTTSTTESTKAPDKATQTGDMMFVVVAVMVVALGAAVVVKKVSVR